LLDGFVGNDMPTGLYLGIDLGTSNSCAALWQTQKNRVKVVRDASGRRVVPSTISFDGNGDAVVGAPEASIGCVKRVIGRKWDQTSRQMLAALPFKAVRTPDGGIGILRGGGQPTLSCEEASSFVLGHLKASAEAWLEEHIAKSARRGLEPITDEPTLNRCVVTVPANFDDVTRKATVAAAKLAGFVEVALLVESTAAAMAYGLFVAGKKHACVFDMGGGTTDVTLMAIDSGRFETLSTEGDTHCGGEDMDTMLMEVVVAKAGGSKAAWGSQDEAKLRLRSRCKAAKEELSEKTETIIALEGRGEVSVTRAEFEACVAELVARAKGVVEAALVSSELVVAEIDEIVLVGGASRVPCVRTMLQEVFQGRELCTSVNADESVASGAAVRGAVLGGVDEGIIADVMMLDALPRSIGLEAEDGRFEVILAKNSRIPAMASKTFILEDPRQNGVTIEAFEGEKPLARDNAFVCRHDIALPPLTEEELERDQLERTVVVTFKVAEGGVLLVKAEDPDDMGVNEDSFKALQILVVVLFFVYLGIKLTFHEPLTGEARLQ